MAETCTTAAPSFLMSAEFIVDVIMFLLIWGITLDVRNMRNGKE